MGFSKMLALLQIKDKGHIILANAGNFYIARGKDALLLNEILGLKLSCLETEICKVGFPINTLEKYTKLIEQKNYSYIVYNYDSAFNKLNIVKRYEGKDKKECEYIYKELSKIRNNVILIQSKDSNYEAGINIVPSYLAKGLEFDCVIVFNANEDKYKQNSLDIKILYVVITRAMSKLDVFYTNNKSQLLE